MVGPPFSGAIVLEKGLSHSCLQHKITLTATESVYHTGKKERKKKDTPGNGHNSEGKASTMHAEGPQNQTAASGKIPT